jgi:hypothetical protein
MLPCPISPPPPALALASPWEIPGQYAIVLTMFVLLGIIIRRLYAKAAKPLTRRTRVGFILLVAGSVCAVAGIGCVWLVFLPSTDHIVAWFGAQPSTIGGQSCSLDAQDALVQSLLGIGLVWAKVMSTVVSCGLAVTSIGGSLIRPAVQRRQVEPRSA